MERIERKNQQLQSLIQDMKKKAIETETPLFKRLALDLEKPVQTARVVNLSKINKFTEADDFIVVPGKVLGSGELDHKLTIVAYKFSASALVKINHAQAKAVQIRDLLKENIKGKRIRILG